uniref:Uncharacterized protein n=1 Tax=Glossina austeni TaxID=7395 RepID=A0A1A9VHI5_GLOAU
MQFSHDREGKILSFLSLEKSFMFCIHLLSDDDNDDVADEVAAAAPTATEEAEVDWKADEDEDAAAEAEDDEGNDELTVVTKVVDCPVFERGAKSSSHRAIITFVDAIFDDGDDDDVDDNSIKCDVSLQYKVLAVTSSNFSRKTRTSEAIAEEEDEIKLRKHLFCF